VAITSSADSKLVRDSVASLMEHLDVEVLSVSLSLVSMREIIRDILS